MSVSNRVLVLGAGGLLGSYVDGVLRRESQFEVIAQAGQKYLRRPDLEAYLDSTNPTIVVNCIGYKGGDTELQFIVNGCLPRAIADWCASRDAGLVQISTNAVFAADESRYWTPSDTPDPTTPYENAKLFGEDPRAYTIRASFIGISNEGQRGVLDAIVAGEPFWDRLWNGITALTLARHIVSVIAKPPLRTGVEHLHSPAVTSFSKIAALLGSDSPVSGYRRDARLLGGGPPTQPLEQQLAELVNGDWT